MHKLCEQKVSRSLFIKNLSVSSFVVKVREDFVLTHDRKDLIIKQNVDRIREPFCQVICKF